MRPSFALALLPLIAAPTILAAPTTVQSDASVAVAREIADAAISELQRRNFNTNLSLEPRAAPEDADDEGPGPAQGVKRKGKGVEIVPDSNPSNPNPSNPNPRKRRKPNPSNPTRKRRKHSNPTPATPETPATPATPLSVPDIRVIPPTPR